MAQSLDFFEEMDSLRLKTIESVPNFANKTGDQDPDHEILR